MRAFGITEPAIQADRLHRFDASFQKSDFASFRTGGLLDFKYDTTANAPPSCVGDDEDTLQLGQPRWPKGIAAAADDESGFASNKKAHILRHQLGHGRT